MANHGGIGAKFVSVNLNKSYGQPSHTNNHNYANYSSSYGANRARPGSGHASAGGGMVVLSRNRPAAKAAPKLSVPPPLNLPSLRKEHEKLDTGPGGGQGGSSGSGSGSRPSSSGMGWTKPGAVALQEKEGVGTESAHDADIAASKGNGAYMPPAARSSGGGGLMVSSSPQSYVPPVDKAVVLRGEDFPSLRAALPASSGPVQKHKDSLSQKQKNLPTEESSNDHGFVLSSPVQMRPQGQSTQHIANGSSENGGQRMNYGSAGMADQPQKQEDPLALVWSNTRTDWADDERDTGLRFAERNREHGFYRNEDFWERDFDLPRSSILPHKSTYNPSERWGQRSDKMGKGLSTEINSPGSFNREASTPGRELKDSDTWRNNSFQRGGSSVHGVMTERNNVGRPFSLGIDSGKDKKYIPPSVADSGRQSVVTGNQDSAFERRDLGNRQQGGQPWNHIVEPVSNRGVDRRMGDRYGAEQPQPNPYRSNTFQNSTSSKSSFSSVGRGLPSNDPLLNFGREKRTFSKANRPYLEDPYPKDLVSTGYDEKDFFPGSLAGVVKKKKDVAKPAEFHDPVRESFEAELERVQKMQEMERQRVIEEQERAMEQVRREEEERQRLIQEDEEKQRKIEEEAREAAWRAEQERLEAIRKAEEQKIARDEEKNKMLMEEERRKQAARQKLLELEARIAKRQAEVGKSGVNVDPDRNDEVLASRNEKDVPVASDLENWEDSERMVERITTSTTSDSSPFSRSFEEISRPHPSREASSSFMDRAKPVNPWRRDIFDNGNYLPFPHDQENVHLSPRRDASFGGRAYARKELDREGGFTSRSSFKGGLQEPMTDGFAHLREHRWNSSGDGDRYFSNRDVEAGFYEDVAEKFDDVGWGPGNSHSNARSTYPEQLYMNSEADELYAFGKSRYSTRQPRVLPPPLVSLHKASLRSENESSGPSTSLENDAHVSPAARSESTAQTAHHGDGQEMLGQPGIADARQEMTTQNLSNNATPRCDSQSSVSVSSPPSSPTHLSHDELDGSDDSNMIHTAEGKEILPSAVQPKIVDDNSGNETMINNTSTSILFDEDEDWSLENNEEMQEQEEYDEDDDGYQEEDEVHEGDHENVDLRQEFEQMHLDEKNSSDAMENSVLGFNEGVEVGIPGDDFEMNSRREENFGVPEVSVGGTGSTRGDVQTHQSMIQSEKAVQGTVIESLTTHTSVTSDLLGIVDPSSDCGLYAQHKIPSSFDMASQSSSVQATTIPSQADLPVKLQFGLFSGPSLIPSPVPAIQIGSIQMPLHLHSPGGPSVSHMHPSQAPLFQFGQLRYTSPVSQGILPMAPQPMSFIQPNIHYSITQNSGGSLPMQPSSAASTLNVVKDDVPNPVNKPSIVSSVPDISHENRSMGMSKFPAMGSSENRATINNGQNVSHAASNRMTSRAGMEGYDDSVQNYSQTLGGKVSDGILQLPPTQTQSLSNQKDSTFSKAPGPLSGRGRRHTYSARNPGARSSFPAYGSPRSGPSEFQSRPRRTIQRTEFRVRENVDGRQTSGQVSSKYSGLDDQPNPNDRGEGTCTGSGFSQGTLSNKSVKQTVESASLVSGPISPQDMDSGSRLGKANTRQAYSRSKVLSSSGDLNLKRNMSEEDVDAPLQSGIVRVFKQPGIEAPSDEDDFIEVRSKRQMLNDRREQREKEIKEKSRVSKVQRKSRSSVQGTINSRGSRKSSASLTDGASKNYHTDSIGSVRSFENKNVSPGLSTKVSQPLAPIGPPTANADAQSDMRSLSKTLQTSPAHVKSGDRKDLGANPLLDTKRKVIDSVKTSLGTWGNAQIDQQVMALTQTQLDDAMKPTQFDTYVKSVRNGSEPMMSSISVQSKDKPISSSASPISSLLAGEKIQFGAVTSPTVLPPSSRVVSHVIGAPGSLRSDNKVSQHLSQVEERSIFFGKDELSDESRVVLEDCEAEAAASAVAVAAISTDEIVGNRPGAVSETKSSGGADFVAMSRVVAGDKQPGGQSRAEESLMVSLPADLSIETPPISLWPPLTSPQSSSSQMLSPFPGAPHSHFPFYEMNHPILGGPIFSFGPHEESGGPQSQPEKSTMSSSGHVGGWQQCHTAVDSFYGPPAGFPGPFISPPGSIPGVQAPPHMVVYNHYTPIGQYGQVGLSFMGAAYIPSGKQPDWKHNPSSSAMSIGEGDKSAMNTVSAQRSTSNMPPTVQHVAPGSPLLPMGSPLQIFDVPPFQTAPEMSFQARWPHIPASPLHSVPMSLPLQQQSEVPMPSQTNPEIHPIQQSSTATRFSEPQTSRTKDHVQPLSVVKDTSANKFPDDLGLVESSSSTVSAISTQPSLSHGSIANHVSSSSIVSNAPRTDPTSRGSQNNTSKTHHLHSKNLSSHPYNQSSGGYGYQRGGASQKYSSAGEWPQRRMGFHGRNQTMGAEKNFPSSKVKQIYVAKQTSSSTGSSSAAS